MKPTLFLVFAMAITPAVSASAENLLADAMTTDESMLNNKEAFYNVWAVHTGFGTRLYAEDQPFSVFSMIEEGWNVPYGNSGLTIGGEDVQGFEVGEPMLVLDYPLISEEGENYFYSYPVNVVSSGKHQVSGIAKCLEQRDASTPSVFDGGIIVIVADPDPTVAKKVERVKEDGVTRIKVSDSTGKEYANIFTTTSSDVHANVKSFAKEISLTTDDKYISIYGPSWTLGFAKLSVSSNTTTVIEPEVTAETAEIIYDINGRCLGVGATQTAPGIYIVKSGSQVSKKIIRN